jgi:hypothetical protein
MISFSIAKASILHNGTALTTARNGAIRCQMKKGAVLLLAFTGLLLPGCVQVTAPDKPIVINLNIAIRQEVLLRLDQVAKKGIDENPELF